VSLGLVRHHFGSKDDLRHACDAHALDRMAGTHAQGFVESQMSEAGLSRAIDPTVLLLQRYLMRSAMDGSEAGAALFGEMVRQGEVWLEMQGIESVDDRAFAAVLVAMQMGVFVMQDQLSRTLGVDVTTPTGRLRVLSGVIDAFARPLLSNDHAERAHAAIRAVMAATSHEAGAIGVRRDADAGDVSGATASLNANSQRHA